MSETKTPRAWFVPIYPPPAFDDGIRLGLWDDAGVKDGRIVAEKNQPMLVNPNVYDFHGTLILKYHYQYGTVTGFSDEINGRNAVHKLRCRR